MINRVLFINKYHIIYKSLNLNFVILNKSTMEKFYKGLGILALISFSLNINAQIEIIKVTPDFKIGQQEAGTVGNLNAAIAEVAANQGTGNVIFELERDAFYFSINEIRPEQQDLHVRAESGEGRRPVIMAAANPDDGRFNQIFYEFTGNMTLEGLHILGTTTEGSQLDQALRTDAENLRVIVNDCIIEKYRDRVLRMQNTGTKAYITNSIIRNMGEPTGGGVGVRVNTYCDTLVVNNCTFYNLNNYIFQNTRNGLNYFEVTNNTFVNFGQSTHIGVDIGRAKEVLVADNIFYNAAFRRNTSTHDPFFRANFQDKDNLPFSEAERSITILNNNWYVDEAVARIYEDNYSSERDTLTREIEVVVDGDATTQTIPFKYTVGDVWIMDENLDPNWDAKPALASLVDSGIVVFENNFREALKFTNSPAYPEAYVSELIKSNWDSDIFEDLEITSETMYWIDEDPQNPFDLGYNQDAASATASTSGGQIGANWSLNSLTDLVNRIIANDNLKVFPNPTKSILNFEKNFDALYIRIFDMTGKLVFQSGNNSNNSLNVGNLNKGIYVIAVTDQSNSIRVARFVKE